MNPHTGTALEDPHNPSGARRMQRKTLNLYHATRSCRGPSTLKIALGVMIGKLYMTTSSIKLTLASTQAITIASSTRVGVCPARASSNCSQSSTLVLGDSRLKA